LEEISEKFMEKILDMANQNVQDALKNMRWLRNKGIQTNKKTNIKVKQRTL
jgi:hypothetical protein